MNNQLFVIPMDGSPKAAECVDRIGPMLAAGDRAVLLHVRDGKSRSDQGAIAEAERKLASRGIAVSREEPAASDAASGIVDFVRSNRPDMVLMQSMGTGDERTGVAERVLRSSPAPVLSIAKEANVRKTFNSILVPTDTTAFSTAVLEPLIPMAKASGASITLLFVDWDDPTDTPEWRSDRRQQRVNHVAQWLREPRKMIEDAGLKARFTPVAEALRANEAAIVDELNAVQGVAVDLGGYYRPDPALAGAAMRPSALLNGIIDDI